MGDATRKQCFKYQGFGHLQANCLNRKAIMYIGDQLVELGTIEDEYEDMKILVNNWSLIVEVEPMLCVKRW